MVHEQQRSANPRIAGRFEVLGRIGSGPHGPTYRARDHRRFLGQSDDPAAWTVALKILRGDSAEAEPEAFDARRDTLLEALSSLEDPVLVTPRDAGRTELGLPYLAFDLVEGTSLEERLATEGPLDPHHARELVRRLALSLQSAHDRGVAHGALDLHHVILLDDDEPRLLDVGLRGLLDEAHGEAKKADAQRADVASLGRLLAAACTGDTSGSRLPEDAQLAHVVQAARASIDPQAAASDAAPIEPFGEASAVAAALSVAPEPLELDPAPTQEVAAGYGTLVTRGPSRKPLVAVMLALALVASAGAWTLRGRSARAAEKAAVAELEHELARREQTAQDLEDELSAARDALAAPVEEAASQRATAVALEARVDELQSRLAERERAADELRAAERSAVAAAEEARRRQVEAETERDAAREELARRRDAEADEGRRANRIAALTAQLDAGPDAPDALGDLVRRDPELAPLLDGPLSPLLESWQTAASALEDSQAATLAEASALVVRARDALVEARRLGGATDADLDLHLGAGQTLGAALDRTLADLESRIDARLDAVEKGRTETWEALLAAPLEATPDAALAMAESFGHDRSAELFEALGSALANASPSDGGDLSAWIPHLPLAGRHGEPLLRHAWAREWRTQAPSVPLDQALRSWPAPRSSLSLGAGPEDPLANGLDECIALFSHRGPFPGQSGRSSLYRSVTAAGRLSWQIETLEDDPAASTSERSWIVHQRFYDEQGTFRSERRVRIVQRGRVLVEEDARDHVVLDGREPVSAGTWSLSQAAPPTRLPIDPAALAAFQRRLAEVELPAFATEHDDGRRLWSARYGLLAHDDPGFVQRELIYADDAAPF